MGIVHVEELRLRQKEIEVRALVALADSGVPQQKFRALNKLEKFAYPKDLADKINQQIAQKKLELL